MKLGSIFLFVLLSCLNSCSQIGILGAAPSKPPASFPEFEAMAATLNDRRYEGNPIISYVPDTWKARQVHFAYVIENPFNSDSLIMFYGGGSILSGLGYMVGRADASKANPYVWVEYAGNPIFNRATFGLGIQSIVGVDDARWNPYEQRFELICCTYAGDGSHLAKYYSDDGYTFTYEGALLAPTGDETHVGNGGILRDGATWYCAYTYRTADSTLPGVRIASSTDSGATWTKHGKFLHLGTPASIYDGQYMEGVQFLKIGSDYVLNYGSASSSFVFSGSLASSSTALGTYTKSSINPYFERPASGWDSLNVSTIVVFNVVEPWLVFYQGNNTPGDYNFALWSMGAAALW
jgi:predicted GH43/DUF377 family glycosyl hydrolase